MLRTTLILLAAGCVGGSDKDDTGTSETLPECTFQEAGFAACLAGGPAGKTTKTSYQQYVYGNRAGEAVVVDVGGHLASDCGTDAWGVGGSAVSLVSETDVVWLQLQHDDDSLVTLGVKADGFDGSGLVVGTELAYDFASAEFYWSPSIGHLELRDATGGLVIWLAEGGRLEDVNPPAELTLTGGDPTCFTEDQCVDGWQSRSFVVGAAGDEAEVLPHDTVDVGGLHVVHGGFDEQTGGSQCPDAYVADLKVAAWPL